MMISHKSVNLHQLLVTSFFLLSLFPLSLMAREARFLSSYENFVPHPEFGIAQIWLKPSSDIKDVAKYKKFLLLPIEVLYALDEQHKGISPDKIKVVTDYFRVSLEASLSPNYLFVDKPASGVAVVRAALSGIRQHSREELNGGDFSIESFLLEVTDSPEVAAGKAVHVLTAVLELEIFDATSGERLFALIDQKSHEEADLHSGDRSFKAIKAVLDNWSERFRATLDSNS